MKKKLLTGFNIHLLKTLSKMGIEGTYLNIKVIYEPTSNSILNSEKLKVFAL